MLPFDLYLTAGSGSLPLFPAGPIDEFRFFQRVHVSEQHKVEFLSRLAPKDAGTEDYKPYGLFRLRSELSLALERPSQVRKLWEVLTKGHGLSRVPEASTMIGRFTAYDPERGKPDAGVNRLQAPRLARSYAKRGRRITYADVLEILRAEMAPREKIAWIEDAFLDDLPAGEIVHRYYLGSNEQAYLVRHHWEQGKRLFRAETSAEAVVICASSAHFRRISRRAA